MYLVNHLSQNERDKLLERLNDRQMTFVKEYLKRGRKTVFANVLAKEKASSVGVDDIEDVASQWELLDYIDAGSDWQKKDEKLYCECGRSLRYQYIVENKETGEIRKFGIKHFQEHTGIPPQLVKDIVKGIEKIDFEMDEILLKIADGWNLKKEGIDTIPSDADIPNDIKQHFDYDVPLLDRQVRRLKERIADHLLEEKRKQLEAKRLEQEIEAKRQREIAVRRSEMLSNKLKAGHNIGVTREIPLEERLQLGVLVYLDSLHTTNVSAREVCMDLITNHGATKETYSSGTPKIFPNVCLYLESLVKQGKLEFIEKQGVEDRIYRRLKGSNTFMD